LSLQNENVRFEQSSNVRPLSWVAGDLPDLSAETWAKLWTALARLGEPVTVRAGERLDIVLPDKTIAVAGLAAKLGLPLEDGR
jgi:hypothetical protein